ncbi:MAG TPA: choice-of-anchor P family protein, partial [Acidimicrobiales bacterium]|nr:choice-of-anchor P family protein [Acidimicrobiales bacterium]
PVVVPVPADPAPNTVIEGKLEGIGDSFRLVFNEQIVEDGAITVNAAHQILLGPTAVGDLVIGQSRCATNDTALSPTDADPVTGSSNVSGRRGGNSTGGLARTGGDAGRLFGLGLAFVALGWLATRLGLRRQPSRAHHGRGPTRRWPAFLRWR